MTKNALVVGANGGLGQAVVRTLLAQDWSVFLGCRSLLTAKALAQSLGGGTPIQIDLNDSSSIEQALRDCGDLDGLVQAAGPAIPMSYVSEVDLLELSKVVETETFGFLSVVQKALPGLRRCKGSIVVLTSAGLARHPAQDIASTVPKAAVEAIVRGIASEEGKFGVRANSVGVGVVEAGMFQRLRESELSEDWLKAAADNIPLGHFGTAEDISNAVHFLLSEESSYITGQRLVVDGGFST